MYNIKGQRFSLPYIILGVILQKGGRFMGFVVTIDWKFVVALGTAAVGVIFAVKMDASKAEQISIHAIDICKKVTTASKGSC